jgi:hypothetical protein
MTAQARGTRLRWARLRAYQCEGVSSAVQARRSEAAAEWTCECGQAHRVAVLDGGRRFWPRNSVDGYSRRGLAEKACSIRCDRSLPVREPMAVESR